MSIIDIKVLFEKYGQRDPGLLAPDDQLALKAGLDSIKIIDNKNDAHKFLHLLALLRKAEVKAIGGLGDSAMATITGAFAGGDEGVYAADTDLMNARFIFELVQNVDDCKYEYVNNCTLDIQFDIESDTIRLEYNELGFQPDNVIAITGLGNSTKNHKKAKNLRAESAIDQGDLQEIGEKGIGFKSIFGLAKKVKIKSRYFCFMIERNNFFVPIVDNYSNYTYTNGTILELTLDAGMVEELYNFLKRKYDRLEAVINENPILFLNKLTQIRYTKSNQEFFGFKVSRSSQIGDNIEEDTKIEYFSSFKWKNRTIDAYRFSHNIEYSLEECRSRYGENEDSTRKHKIIVIAPKKADMINQGRIYSFFATSEEIYAPFIIHAPFKLNSGRTRIDSQSQSAVSQNQWFLRTQKETAKMIRHVYERLAVLQGAQIRFYIPKDCLFSTRCVLYSCREISKINILSWNIFEDVNGDYWPANNVCMIDFNANMESLMEIHRLLGIKKRLLRISSKDISLFEDYIEVTRDVQNKLLKCALRDREKTINCLKFIEDYDPKFSVREITGAGLSLDYTQIKEISKFERICAWINKHTFEFMKPGFAGAKIDIDYIGDTKSTLIIKNYCEDYGDAINKDFLNYLNRIKFCEGDFDNSIYLYNAIFGRNMLETLAKAYQRFVPHDKFFSLLLKIEAVSEEIDRLCNRGSDISDYEFLSLLKTHRISQKNTMGTQYASILELIEKSGTSTERFFPEILQNIDDELVENVEIRHDKVSTECKLYVEYDKITFSREKIRAITAIGDSTKKTLLSSHTTGEKGIGFKSVFAFCSNVLIESGNFAFKLLAEKPTVPEPVPNSNYLNGTRMVFTLKPREIRTVVDFLSDEQKLIKTCLCLKQLHTIYINNKKLEIDDKVDRKIVTCGTSRREYLKYIYPIKIEDYLALQQRKRTKNVLEIQKIEYLVPMDDSEFEPCIYSTFPTQEQINIPMIINMPLELDTARERIQEGEWNQEVIRQMMNGLLFVYDNLKNRKKEKLSMFFPIDGKVLNHKYGQSAILLERIAVRPLFKLALKNEYVSLNTGIFSCDFEYMLLERYGSNLDANMKSQLLAIDAESVKRLYLLFPNYIRMRSFDDVCQVVNNLFIKMKKQSNEIIKDKYFRDSLYKFLCDSNTSVNKHKSAHLIKQWEIVPIRLHKKTRYVCYLEDIYAPGSENIDSEKYKILDKQLMSVEIYNQIYSCINETYKPIQVFSKDIVISEFFNEVCSLLKNYNPKDRAEKILAIYNSEKNLFREMYKSRKDFLIERMCFKTRTGRFYEKQNCYACDDLETQQCLDDIIVSKEYTELAKLVKVAMVEEISSYRQIPFEIGRKELAELKNNKHLNKKMELFVSLYLCDNRSNSLRDGMGFFELYSLVPRKVRLGREQPSNSIFITEEILQSYSREINEISINDVPIKFVVRFNSFVFEKDNILSEIENELQLRKESDKISTIMDMLSNCFYASIFRREACCVRTQNKNVLVIDSKITADYDIIDVLKSYFLQYFNTELSVNRNIRLYTRRGFENISTIYSTKEDVIAALPMIAGVNFNNIEEVKDFLCKPLILNGVTYGGYAKTCPLCGARVDTELTGMRIYKTKSNGLIIPLISCSNCYENLRYSSNVNIDTEKLNDGILEMECRINGFEWHISDKTIRLGHRVLIRKMNQK